MLKASFPSYATVTFFRCYLQHGRGLFSSSLSRSRASFFVILGSLPTGISPVRALITSGELQGREVTLYYGTTSAVGSG